MTPASAALLSALGSCVASLLVSGLVRVRGARGVAFALVAGAGAAAFVAAILALHGRPDAVHFGEHLALRLDALSAFFVLVLGSVAAVAGLFACGRARGDERGLGLHASGSAAAILLAALVVCAADDVWLFLFGWELLAVAFAWAIAFAGRRPGAGRAAYFTLVITHAAGAALLAALLLLTAHTGTSLDAAAASFAGLEPVLASVVFVLLLTGFGVKVGLVPLQGWMPDAYAAAPGPVAALMAAGALNVGFYGIERFIIASPVSIRVWWAILVLALGAAGAVGGIVWALAQRNLRRLAAYSSVENAGIILVGLGVALAGRAIALPLLTGFGLAAAAVQILAHAFAKATLFLVSSDVEDAARTDSFDLLGGLWRPLPVASAAAVTAALSLAALPPFGGFAGEWLSLEACMQAFRTHSPSLELALALAGAAIGLAAAVAVVAFVKTAGVAFLGAPRSESAARAHGSRSFSAAFAYAALVTASLLVGSATPAVLRLIAPAIDSTAHVAAVAPMIAQVPLLQPPFPGFSSTSGFALAATVLAFALGFRLLVALVPRPASRRVAPWSSGGTYAPWTQYTGTGFSNASRVVLDFVGRIVRVTRGGIESEGVLEYESYSRPPGDVTQARFLATPFLWIASLVRKTQSGSISAYLSYILVFTIALLMCYPLLRRW